jgi:hypothetical protein
MGGQLEDYNQPEITKAPPAPSVEYTVSIYGHSCRITLNSMDKEQLDGLVDLIVGYLEDA